MTQEHQADDSAPKRRGRQGISRAPKRRGRQGISREAVQLAMETLSSQLGREPTLAELRAETGTGSMTTLTRHRRAVLDERLMQSRGNPSPSVALAADPSASDQLTACEHARDVALARVVELEKAELVLQTRLDSAHTALAAAETRLQVTNIGKLSVNAPREACKNVCLVTPTQTR